MMFWYDHDLNTWGWIGMSIGMIVFWGVLVGGIVLAVRGLGDHRREPERSAGPEQLLAERFARGEIDEAEYHDRLAALRGDKRPTVRS